MYGGDVGAPLPIYGGAPPLPIRGGTPLPKGPVAPLPSVGVLLPITVGAPVTTAGVVMGFGLTGDLLSTGGGPAG